MCLYNVAPLRPKALNPRRLSKPAKSIMTMSTTYLPFLDKLGVLNRLVGVDDTTYVNNPAVLKMAEEGKLATIGYGASVNVEKVLEVARIW